MCKKIFITGVAGFIGSHIAEFLLRNENDVIIYGVDNLTDNYNVDFKRENLSLLNKFDNFKFYNQDILTTKLISVIKPNHIYHMASIPGVQRSMESPQYYVKNNVEAFVNILEECRKNPVEKFVYASSSSVYGANDKIPFTESDRCEELISPYACSKKCMETYAQYYHKVHNVPMIGLRFFTVYGERGRPDMAPYIFLKSIAEKAEIIQYGDGGSYRDYTYISDIISAIHSIYCGNGEPGSIYNLGNSTPVTLTKFIEICEKITGKRANRRVVNTRIGDVTRTFADITKAKTELNYDPQISLDTGLYKMFEWMRKHDRIDTTTI